MFDTFNAVVTVPLVCTQVSAGWHSTYEDLLTKYIYYYNFYVYFNNNSAICCVLHNYT